MMFAVKYDDLRRKFLALDNPIELNKLSTCQENTPEFETWINVYLAPENNTIHTIVETDNRTYTFFTVPTELQKPVENQKETS